MEVKCSLCGRRVELSKSHKDYQKMVKNPKQSYICLHCKSMIQFEAQEHGKPKKPM